MSMSNRQKQKIKNLEGEMDRLKANKVQMMRRMKEDQDKHKKWKDEKTKELMNMKRMNLKKDKELTKLKRDNKRKEDLAKRKQ